MDRKGLGQVADQDPMGGDLDRVVPDRDREVRRRIGLKVNPSCSASCQLPQRRLAVCATLQRQARAQEPLACLFHQK